MRQPGRRRHVPGSAAKQLGKISGRFGHRWVRSHRWRQDGLLRCRRRRWYRYLPRVILRWLVFPSHFGLWPTARLGPVLARASGWHRGRRVLRRGRGGRCRCFLLSTEELGELAGGVFLRDRFHLPGLFRPGRLWSGGRQLVGGRWRDAWAGILRRSVVAWRARCRRPAGVGPSGWRLVRQGAEQSGELTGTLRGFWGRRRSSCRLLGIGGERRFSRFGSGLTERCRRRKTQPPFERDEVRQVL